MIWLFKLTVTPLLIAAATLVMRRFGPRIGGLLLGFPIMAGPISVFLAIEQGPLFAADAAIGTLLALTGVAAFSAIYGLIAPFANWPPALLVSTAGFLGVSAVAARMEPGIAGASLGAVLAIGLALAALRAPREALRLGPALWWDIWLRMATAALLITAITLIAERLGPVWSGIVGTYPIITSVAICFMHHQWGHVAAVIGLRGILLSLFAFSAFFIAVALALRSLGILEAYLVGTGAAAATSLAVHTVERLWRGAQMRRAQGPA